MYKVLFKGLFASVFKYAQAIKLHIYHLVQKINVNLTEEVVKDAVHVISQGLQGSTLDEMYEKNPLNKNREFLKFVGKLFKMSKASQI